VRWSTIATLGAGVAVLAALCGSAGDLVLGEGTAAAANPVRCSDVTDNCDQTTAYTETVNVPITMSDGTILEADEYVPVTCTAKTPCPVILIQTPYRKGDGSVSIDDLPSLISSEAIPYLYEHGYIEVEVDVRGTGSSEGYWDSLGPREQQDGAELAQWVANPAHLPTNGDVGLAGGSYAAINQLLTVEAISADIAGDGPLTDPGSGCTTSATFECANPTHITSNPVKAIVPVAPMADTYRDIVFAGGDADLGFVPAWLGAVNVGNAEPPDQTLSEPAIALNAESQHIADLTRFAVPAVADSAPGAYESLLPEALQTYPQQAYDSPFYTQRSPITDIGGVDVPTFLFGGTYDIFQRGEPILYNALDLPPSEKKLMIGPWYHGTVGSGLPTTDNAGNTIPGAGELELAWFDHWLKGTDNGVETFPTVETYQLGADTWVPVTAYPAPGTTGQRWYLGSGKTLSTSPSPTPGRAELSAVTATGTCSGSTWQWAFGWTPVVDYPSPVCQSNSTVSQGQGLTFTTAPFTKPYTVSGPIEADIYMSSTATDSSVVATVSDVSSSAAGGITTAKDVTAGTLVASLRAVTPTPCGRVVLNCSVYLDFQSIEPWHPYTQASQAALQPGKIYELRIEIFPTSQTFEPGHAMRVTITTSDIPHELQTVSTTVHSVGVDTFYFGGNAPSSIFLGATRPATGTTGAG